MTYSPAKFKLPAGATLTIKGDYPHARYFGIDTFNGPVPVDAISGFQLEPDSGATNPFRPGADRSAGLRGYTLSLVEQVKPEKPAPNTLYLKPAQAGSLAGYSPELRLRTYFPDRGQDVPGGVAYPRRHSLELADGRVITGEENICRSINLNATLGDLSETALPLKMLNTLVSIAPNPARAPAQETPLWERFFNFAYSLFGLFLLPGAEEMRAQIPVPKPDGGGVGSLAGTVANAYVGSYLSHETPEREIAVTRVKVANTPATFDNPRILASPEPLQAQYWSICTNIDVAGTGRTPEGFPTGVRQGLCHNDETVGLNNERYTRIVHSQAQNRPKNATNESGWSCLNSGPGDASGRPVVQVILRPWLAVEASFA